MYSVGVDIVSIDRFRSSLLQKGFLERVYGDQEKKLIVERGYPDNQRSIETAAANFCAKEAFSKALGSGIRGFSLNEVELLRDTLGAPYLFFTGRAKTLAEGKQFSVSVSHCELYAIATVIMEKLNNNKEDER